MIRRSSSLGAAAGTKVPASLPSSRSSRENRTDKTANHQPTVEISRHRRLVSQQHAIQDHHPINTLAPSHPTTGIPPTSTSTQSRCGLSTGVCAWLRARAPLGPLRRIETCEKERETHIGTDDANVIRLFPPSLRCPLLPRAAEQARQAAVPRPRQRRQDDAPAHVEGA